MTTGFDGLYPAGTRRSRFPGLPLKFPPAHSDTPVGEIRCAITSVDPRGRLGERSAVRSLRWEPGQRIRFETDSYVAVIDAAAEGKQSIGPSGYLHLPAAIRHACDISVGDRVLLVADLGRERLVVYSMALVAAALWNHRPRLWGIGDAVSRVRLCGRARCLRV
ncbi:hypothetical protein [Nocardia aurea]|uniref:hypothetical protein n=1 Tax=Nocardia aurea TaxID=2144174 RepID=UPI0033B6FF5C